MSNSRKISLLKQKSEIDYSLLFMPLWLSLNAWMRDKFNEETDRSLIELLKNTDDTLYSEFSGLIDVVKENEKIHNIIFKDCFFEFCRALEGANIEFLRLPKNLENSNDKKVSFEHTILDWRSKDPKPKFESIIKKQEYDGDKIEISPNFYIDSDIKRVFKAYIENLYQVRCTLFHGGLLLDEKNKDLVRCSYLTLQMVMKDI